MRQNRSQPIVLGLHDYTSICSPIIIAPHHSWLLLSQEPTIEHGPSYNSHFLDLLQHHFWPFPSTQDRL